MYKFLQAIKGKKEISVIAEIKRRSPSHGNFPKQDLDTLIRQYEKGGARAISVVTEKTYFNGNLELLKKIRKKTKLPIIRKDFIQEIGQIRETKNAGADAILLIAKKLEKILLKKFAEESLKTGLDVVIEIHDQKDFEKIQSVCKTLTKKIAIGINNRNLSNFEVNIHHAKNLLHLFNKKTIIIAESGFSKTEEISDYQGKIDAILVGTALLNTANPYQLLNSMTHACDTAK